MQALEFACLGVEPCISVHVFGYKRIEALETLLKILASSNYTGYDHSLPIVIHVDGPQTTHDGNVTIAIRRLVEDIQWTHGPKILDFNEKNIGLKASWLEAWPNPKPNDVMIAFEDDVFPSTMYFQWLLKVLGEYKLNDESRDPSLLGISLSPMLMDEITYPFRLWMTHEKISSQYPVFLHAVPSSWGVAYFGKPWREFLDFVAVRSAPPFYTVNEAALNLTGYGWHTKRGDPNLWLPNSRTNNWVHSWKRNMVDFAYGRGAYMLYPNLINSGGLATSTFIQGVHIPDGSYKNPRRAQLADAKDLSLDKPFPSYATIPLVDMHGDNITRRDLSHRGDRFLDRISGLGQQYVVLANHWRRRCLLDVASHAELRNSNGLIGNPLHSPPAARYLVVAPQMGFTNQMIAILYSAIWAHILDRSLVLPYIIWPRASSKDTHPERWVSFHEIFDPQDILKSLPGIDYVYANRDAMAELQPRRMGMIEPEPQFDSLDNNAYVQGFGWSRTEPVDLVAHRPALATKDMVYQNLGSCQEKALLLNGLYKNPQIDDVPEKLRLQLWQSLFQPNFLVKHIIQKMRHTITGNESPRSAVSNSSAYACLHIRLGDFSQVCSASSDSAPWLANLYKKGRRCSVSLDDIVEMMDSLAVPNFVIISDDPDILTNVLSMVRAPNASVIRAHNVWTTADFHSCVDDILPRIRPNPSKQLMETISAVVEQHICAEAPHVVLNAFSTFSRSISFYRGYMDGIKYW
jgi:hypothetical protein